LIYAEPNENIRTVYDPVLRRVLPGHSAAAYSEDAGQAHAVHQTDRFAVTPPVCR
jgi:hypothetical protein